MDLLAELDGRETPEEKRMISVDEDDETSRSKSSKFSWKIFVQYVGPGWLMSLAFIDPGNMEADLQAGAFTSFKFLWVLLLAHLMGLLVQTFASRLGVVTGKSLAMICRDNYHWTLRWFLWFMAELAIIGADVQEVVGSSIALHVLFGVPLWMGCIITGLLTVGFLIVYHMHGVRIIEYFVVVMVCVIFVCFSLNFAATNPDFLSLFNGLLVPRLPTTVGQTTQVVAMIGSVIMPHNLFLHSNLIARKNLDRKSSRSIAQAIRYFVYDSIFALVFSFMINLALQGSFAQGFFSTHCASNPGSPLGCDPSVEFPDFSVCKLQDCACTTPSGLVGVCSSIGLANAGSSLASILPERASLLFGLGLLAAGQASTVSGTMAGQYVMEGFLDLKISFWLRMLVTRSVALIPAIAVSLMQFEFQSMDGLNQFINVLQSVQLPFALLPLLHFTSTWEVMSKWTIFGFQRLCGWVIALGLIAVNVYMIRQRYLGVHSHTVQTVCSSIATIYVLILLWIVREDIRQFLRFLMGRSSPPSTPQPAATYSKLN